MKKFLLIDLPRLAVLGALMGVLAACSTDEVPAPRPEGKEPDVAQKTPGAPMAPFAGQADSGNAEEQLKELETLKEKHKDAKDAFQKAPKDAKVKEAYIAAAMALANNTVNNPGLPSKEKYPDALRLYREVIELDPENKEAVEWRDTIIGIYKQMNLPIPE